MDDIQLIIYIILVAFGLFSRFFKAKKNPAPKKSKPLTENPKEKPAKELSFEELLREFTESKNPSPIPEPEVEYEEEFDIHDDDEIQRVYEKAQLESKKYEKQNVMDDRHTGSFIHFKGYAEADTEEEESEFASLLSDPDSARRAIIMTEIINRKY